MTAMERTILIATHNPGKVREIAAVLAETPTPVPIRWLSLDDLPDHIEEPHEDQPTFAGNAALKARYYSTRSGLWTLADDSGLEVDALGGAPGVRSARYAVVPNSSTCVGSNRSHQDAANNAKLVAALACIPEERRAARFRCCLALADGDRILLTSEGRIEGRIVDAPRGHGGFGYDPHFFVDALGCTTAELPLSEKNRISHRGQAVRSLRTRLVALLTDR